MPVADMFPHARQYVRYQMKCPNKIRPWQSDSDNKQQVTDESGLPTLYVNTNLTSLLAHPANSNTCHYGSSISTLSANRLRLVHTDRYMSHANAHQRLANRMFEHRPSQHRLILYLLKGWSFPKTFLAEKQQA